MAIGDRVSYPAPLGSGGTLNITGIDVGGGKIAIGQGRQIPRPAGTRVVAQAGTPERSPPPPHPAHPAPADHKSAHATARSRRHPTDTARRGRGRRPHGQ